MHQKLTITTDSGATVEAQAPVIISASRSTDIPAFHAQWFIDRLKAGYVVWVNPFNRQPMVVSFKNTKVVVFWSKNPQPIIPYLKELDDRGIHYYFHFTLNDYEQEGFEPNVPPLRERIETFKSLSGRIGKEKVIWRFDPLIVTPTLTHISFSYSFLFFLLHFFVINQRHNKKNCGNDKTTPRKFSIHNATYYDI